jgi:SAM-dependent methyltransferase
VESPEQIKAFYSTHSETNWVKRYQSPYLIRRYFSRTMWQVIARPVEDCPVVLDAGCGDGVLSVLMALWHPRQRVIAIDISQEAVCRAREAAIAHGVDDRMVFVVGDAEWLPFQDDALSGMVSSQVLEHLPDFDRGVQEIRRVLDLGGICVIAIPACLNPSAMVLLGGGNYWLVRKRTLVAFWIGFLRVLWALMKGKEGVQEGYAGHIELPHIRRFPWRAIQRVEQHGLKVECWMADSLLVPYLAYFFPPLLRLQQWFDEKMRARRFWRNFGVGVVMVVPRKES